MNITGRNKLIIRGNDKLFEAELDLDLSDEIIENKIVKPILFVQNTIRPYKTGWITCKGFVLSKNIEFTHEQAIANVNRVFSEILEQAFRELGENSNGLLKSEFTYSNSILKSESPVIVTIELSLNICKVEFKVVTSANSYEECNEKARNLLRDFIGELRNNKEESK